MHGNELVSETSKLPKYYLNNWAATNRRVISEIPLDEIQISDRRAVGYTSGTKSLQTSLRLIVPLLLL